MKTNDDFHQYDNQQVNDPLFERYQHWQQSQPTQLPAGFADRVCLAYSTQQNRRRWIKRGAGTLAALAACALLAVSLRTNQPQPQPQSVPQPELAKITPEASLTAELAKAGDAFVALSQQTTEKTLKPTQTLMATAEAVPLSGLEFPQTQGQLPSIAFLSQDTLEPVTSQPRQAVNLILRDYGFSTGPRK